VAMAGLLLWWVVLIQLDGGWLPLAERYTTNLHVGLWIFLVEFFRDVWNQSSLAPLRPLSSASVPNPEALSLTRCEQTVQRLAAALPPVGFHLLLRPPLLVLATALAIAWCGDAAIVRMASIVPTLVFHVARKYQPHPVLVEEVTRIRGTHLGNPADAERRAAELRAWAETQPPEEN
jgi:hypothetical protein